MMTRKDFEQIAREYGWFFHREGLRFDPSNGVIVAPDSDEATLPGSYLIGWQHAMNVTRIAFQANNERFDSERFMKAVNNYADLADKIGNRIFEQ